MGSGGTRIGADGGEVRAPGFESAPSSRGGRDRTHRIADLAVHLDGGERDAAKIAYLQTIHAIFCAHVEVFFANPITTAFIPIGPGYEGLPAEIWAEGAAAGDVAERKIRARLDDLDFAAELRRVDGMPHELVPATATLARSLDLFLLGRPDGDRWRTDILEAVLFDAGAPALVMPPDAAAAKDPRTILIGWRDTTECSHAIAASLPFLERAAQVHLVSVAETSSSEEKRIEPAADMAKHLSRHGISVEVRHLPKWNHPAEALLNEAAIVGADLVVAGAYGRSRLREMIFGGVTRALLRDCPIPLLMAH
ncbi:MAG TPA: universal stress protein [Aurantimonas sp.]